MKGSSERSKSVLGDETAALEASRRASSRILATSSIARSPRQLESAPESGSGVLRVLPGAAGRVTPKPIRADSNKGARIGREMTALNPGEQAASTGFPGEWSAARFTAGRARVEVSSLVNSRIKTGERSSEQVKVSNKKHRDRERAKVISLGGKRGKIKTRPGQQQGQGGQQGGRGQQGPAAIRGGNPGENRAGSAG